MSAKQQAKAERKGPERKGPERKGPERKGPERKGPDGKGPDGKVPERNAKDSAGTGSGRRRFWRAVPADAHEWVTFEDPSEQRTWRFDVTFLLSRWECIFGRGCQGVLTGLAPEMEQGCCSYGAHFTDEQDVARVKEAAKSLTDDQWQYAALGRKAGVTRRRSGQAATTRLVDGACIFLNRPGFPGGSGCALHRAAVERGSHPMELKPDVCWQLPLRREDTSSPDGSVTSTLGQWDRTHWGTGGDEFAWWCTEAPEAFRGATPVWQHMHAELTALIGEPVFALLSHYLRGREAAGAALPHPSARREVHDRAKSAKGQQ
ncbi:MAG TPA: hypothetical protein VME46_09575 [Acidimicrobiales bacterium]|nr:hypothetical protein [Acidimicrobiales bacterium]